MNFFKILILRVLIGQIEARNLKFVYKYSVQLNCWPIRVKKYVNKILLNFEKDVEFSIFFGVFFKHCDLMQCHWMIVALSFWPFTMQMCCKKSPRLLSTYLSSCIIIFPVLSKGLYRGTTWLGIKTVRCNFWLLAMSSKSTQTDNVTNA